jgi:hypothetical protein
MNVLLTKGAGDAEILKIYRERLRPAPCWTSSQTSS